MTATVRVRRATRSDVPALVALHRALVEDQLRYAPEPALDPRFDGRVYFERRLADPARWTLVAERGEAGELVGYVDGLLVSGPGARKRALLARVARALSRRPDEAPLRQVRTEAYLANVFVRPEARRHGVARALVAELAACARAAGAQVLHTDVLAGNTGSETLFRDAGFTPALSRLSLPLDR